MSSSPSSYRIHMQPLVPVEFNQRSINQRNSAGEEVVSPSSSPLKSINLHKLETVLNRLMRMNDEYQYRDALHITLATLALSAVDTKIDDVIYLIDSSINDSIGNLLSITRERRKMVEFANNTIYRLKDRQLKNVTNRIIDR